MRVDTTRWTAPSFHPSAKLIETVPLSLRDPSQHIASPTCTVHVANYWTIIDTPLFYPLLDVIYNYVSKSSPISPLPFRRKKEHTSFRIINVSFFQSPGKRVNHRVTEIRRRRMPPPPVRSTSFQVSPLPLFEKRNGRPRVFPTRQPFFLFSSAVWQPLPSSLTNIYTHTHTSLSSRTKVRT